MKRIWTAAAAKSLQLCPILCDPIDGSPPGSPIPGILQAITLEWAAISFSNAWKWKVKVKLLSRVRLLVTPWTAVHQAPWFMGFSRQEYWSGLPLPSPEYEPMNQQMVCKIRTVSKPPNQSIKKLHANMTLNKSINNGLRPQSPWNIQQTPSSGR